MPRALFARLALPLTVLALLGCGRQPAGRDAEMQDLRDRMDRLERQDADDRAKLAEELAAMREDVAALHAALDASGQRQGEPAAQEPAPAHPAKSPRANLRKSLHEMYESSRNAIGRLEQKLDGSLHRVQSKNATEPQTN